MLLVNWQPSCLVYLLKAIYAGDFAAKSSFVAASADAH